ncbi:MAG TPA: CBS domain-containing protein [Polyangia bacterium]|nr:CBS domain-containing protein [Polyangia bacterium]
METADAGSCHVGEVMGTELFTLTPDTVVASARRLAWGNGVRHLLVLDGGTLTGIVCDEDLRTAARDALVGELMRTPVLCIAPDTTLDEATELMEEHGVSCLPVVKGSELVGIVTREGLASLTGGAEAEADVCVACGASDEVRRDPRAGMVALCADCLGRKLPSILASSTS